MTDKTLWKMAANTNLPVRDRAIGCHQLNQSLSIVGVMSAHQNPETTQRLRILEAEMRYAAQDLLRMAGELADLRHASPAPAISGSISG